MKSVKTKKILKKALPKKKVKKAKIEEPEKDRYWQSIGRRKKAIARVRLFTRGEKEIIVNDKPLEEYFKDKQLSQAAYSSLKKMNSEERFRVVSRVRGGGLRGQAEALRHGIARALIAFNPDFRARLKKSGFLTRDPRMRERKHFGLKRARRAPQWKKR